MSDKKSIQGRRFVPQKFPSPFNAPGYFSSSSICLIDLMAHQEDAVRKEMTRARVAYDLDEIKE
jgi:hypothetical protein